MKNLFLSLVCVLAFSAINAQEKKIVETSFEVDGVCGMCKDRIEGAVMRTSGVKFAEWNIETHQLKVIYKNSKVTEDEIHQAIIAVGHDTEKLTADSAVYKKIHPCCYYRDGEVVKDHQKKVKSGNTGH